MNQAPIIAADSNGIEKAAECVLSGGLIVYPTETVYGLGADPFHSSALERIFTIKARDRDKSLILLLPNGDYLSNLVSSVPEEARVLMDAFWPGPLTLVLPGKQALPDALLGPDATIAVRISDSPVCQELLSHLGSAITSTSANRSTCPPAVSVREAVRNLGTEVDMILDGGPAVDTRPSTLVKVTDRPKILREGRISSDAIRNILAK